jgi:hypothetical protein
MGPTGQQRCWRLVLQLMPLAAGPFCIFSVMKKGPELYPRHKTALVARVYFYKSLKCGIILIFLKFLHILEVISYYRRLEKIKENTCKYIFLDSVTSKWSSLCLWSKERYFHGFGSDEACPAFLSFCCTVRVRRGSYKRQGRRGSFLRV